MIKIRVGVILVTFCQFQYVLPHALEEIFSYLVIKHCTEKNLHPIFLMIENPC